MALRHLNLRDFVIVPALDLALGGGFTALTGETGAGKSILLDAVGLVLGNRADSALVRAGADFLAVSHAVWGGDEVAAIEAFAKAMRG